MKLIIFLFLVLTISLALNTHHKDNLSKRKDGEDTENSQSQVKSDQQASESGQGSTEAKGEPENKAFGALINNIYDYAKEFMKYKEDPEKRRIRAGLLANFYPKKQRELAKKNAVAAKKQGFLIKYLTQPWRFCVYPMLEVNAITYCDATFQKISKERAQDCKNMMCLNCCDHLLYVLKFATQQSIVSEILGLSDDAGFNKLKGFVTGDVIDQCRTTCQDEYPVEEPIILPAPPKDKNLGKTINNPAKSCIDIKMNGVKAEDGIYYVKAGKKPAFKVYCDMTTDGGGWTLFYSYVHHPFEEFDLDGTKLPTDPLHSRSHMHLMEAGFDSYDVTELRFYCTSDHDRPKMIHYKTSNAKLLQVALTGDQNYMSQNDVKKETTDLPVPKDNKFFNVVRGSLPKTVSEVGKNVKGGFWDQPFGDGDHFWTIKGPNKNSGRYECDDSLEGSNGSKYETLHQVWFRGQPPSKDQKEARALGG